MNNETTSPSINNEVPVVTAEIAKAKLKLSLTEAELNIQAVQTKADKLVFNEDNLTEIKETISAIKAINKKIDESHETAKAPAWAECKAWDAAKNDLKGLLAPILFKVEGKHTTLCQAVEKRKREADAETARKKGIEDLLNTTILGFSQEITACKTSAELISIQARINAEQGKKSAYQEYLPALIERCAELNQPLKDQKEAIKQLEGLNAVEEVALATGDDQTLLEIQDKKEEINGKIQENKVKTEESAINSSIRGYGGGGYTQTFPSVKAKRQVWKWEITDMELFAKKHPDFVQLVPRKEVIDETIRELKAKETITEGTRDGLRIYLDKTY